MKIFVKEEVNTGRQFEFDLAKAVCILGMVFVHCFDCFSAAGNGEPTTAYYVLVTVLDAIFGAGTFMLCMGLGIAYSWKGNAEKLIRRGLRIFLLGYLLNLLREGIPFLLLYLMGSPTFTLKAAEAVTLCTDIMPFAGLALMLFGLLKKLKLPDWAVLSIALALSAVGSFVRFLCFDNILLEEVVGLFVGTLNPKKEDLMATFPLINWFIIVEAGYLYGNLLRRCANKTRYYAFALPVSGVLLGVYMAIAIPGRFGMMSEQIQYYYQMSVWEMPVLLMGAVFITSVYYFISKILSERVRKGITRLSVNINTVYIIHWIMIGWLYFFLVAFSEWEGFGDRPVFLIGIGIYLAANALAWVIKKPKNERRITE